MSADYANLVAELRSAGSHHEYVTAATFQLLVRRAADALTVKVVAGERLRVEAATEVVEVEEIDLIGALTNALDKAVANAAEHSSSAQIAEALREIAENYLYDGDSDGPQPGYDELWDLAASVEDLRAEATTGAVIAQRLAALAATAESNARYCRSSIHESDRKQYDRVQAASEGIRSAADLADAIAPELPQAATDD